MHATPSGAAFWTKNCAIFSDTGAMSRTVSGVTRASSTSWNPALFNASAARTARGPRTTIESPEASLPTVSAARLGNPVFCTASDTRKPCCAYTAALGTPTAHVSTSDEQEVFLWINRNWSSVSPSYSSALVSPPPGVWDLSEQVRIGAGASTGKGSLQGPAGGSRAAASRGKIGLRVRRRCGGPRPRGRRKGLERARGGRRDRAAVWGVARQPDYRGAQRELPRAVQRARFRAGRVDCPGVGGRGRRVGRLR